MLARAGRAHDRPLIQGTHMADFRWVMRPDGWGEEAVDLHERRSFWLSHPQSEPQGDELNEYYLMPDGRWILHYAVQDGGGETEADNGWSKGWRFECLPKVCHDFLFYRGTIPPDVGALHEVLS